jgi:hypothetical protein
MKSSALLTGSQVATELGLTSRRVAQLAAAGRIKYTSTPLGRLYAREHVDRLARERNVSRSRTRR